MKPLADIRILDLTQNLAGPFCAQILGDMGAEVIKVEPPGGDPARPWGPPFWGSDSALFLSVNRNKRSMVLNLKSDEGRQVLRELASECDVFLESGRLGVAERLGYDYDSIKALREDVIYLSITAFGDRGPLKELPGYEPLIQAFSGIMSVTGEAEGSPVRVGGSVVDYGTGMWSAIAVLGALRARDQTGEGARIDTALLDTAVGWVSYHLMGYLATGRVPQRMGSGLASIAPYRAYPTRDGHVMISGGNDAIFSRLCAAFEFSELAVDPRFATNPARVENREELDTYIEPVMADMETEEAVALLREHSVPCSPIQDISEVVDHPQIHATGILPNAPHPEVPDYRDAAIPLRINGDRPRGGRAAPRAGEHTRELLAELGYSEDEVSDLEARGIVEARAEVEAGASGGE